jgi:hypothetical protein
MESDAIAFSTKYQRDSSVRRRRSDGDIFLIRFTAVVRIDTFSDAVFSLCDGTSDVLTMIKMMVRRYREHEPVSVAAHTLYNLEYFYERGLIRHR